jgi:hypothetical protein
MRPEGVELGIELVKYYSLDAVVDSMGPSFQVWCTMLPKELTKKYFKKHNTWNFTFPTKSKRKGDTVTVPA